MLNPGSNAADAFARLVAIMAKLRAPDGCPWDREQSPQSAVPYLLEEAFEAAEAIDSAEADEVCEELGDVLLQVVFQAQMVADTTGAFSITEVTNAVCEKMIRRHPHVFGDVEAKDSAEVLRNWEKIKAEEKASRKSILDGLPKGLPALLQGFRLGQKASRVGFDWREPGAVRGKVQEELQELDEALAQGATPEALEHELGDVLFSVCQLARHLDIDPESALRRCNQRFTRRFQHIESQVTQLDDLSAEAWEQAWDHAKQQEPSK